MKSRKVDDTWTLTTYECDDPELDLPPFGRPDLSRSDGVTVEFEDDGGIYVDAPGDGIYALQVSGPAMEALREANRAYDEAHEAERDGAECGR